MTSGRSLHTGKRPRHHLCEREECKYAKTYTAQFTSEEGQEKLKVFRVAGTATEQKVNGEIQRLLKNQGILSAEIAPVAPGIPLDAIVKGMPYTVAYITV